MMGGVADPQAKVVELPPPDGYVSGTDYKILSMQYWAIKKSLNMLLKNRRSKQ